MDDEIFFNDQPYNSCELSLIQQILIMFAVIQFSLISACLFVSQTHSILDEEKEEEEEEEIRYIDNYPLENATQENEKVNPNTYVLELAPKGIIILKYDYDEEGFTYWTNSSSVDYKVLETVARKFVTNFCCKELFIDREQNLTEKKEALEEKVKQEAELEKMNEEDLQHTEQDDLEETENDVFATFKSYNKKGGAKKEEDDKKNVIVADKANKYIKKGNIRDFEILDKKYKELEKEKKEKEGEKGQPEQSIMDFALFKQMIFGENKKIEKENKKEN